MITRVVMNQTEYEELFGANDEQFSIINRKYNCRLFNGGFTMHADGCNCDMESDYIRDERDAQEQEIINQDPRDPLS